MYYFGILIVVALLGVGSFLLITGQKSQPSQEMNMQMEKHDSHAKVTNDKTFLEDMIPHHEEAVTDSEALLKLDVSPETKTLAEGIITAQKKEIADMKRWYKDWFGKEYKETGTYMPMMSKVDKEDVKAAEKKYLAEMIMHHEMAVQTAKAILPITKKAEIKKLSSNIISSQNKEIETMKHLLQ